MSSGRGRGVDDAPGSAVHTRSQHCQQHSVDNKLGNAPRVPLRTIPINFGVATTSERDIRTAVPVQLSLLLPRQAVQATATAAPADMHHWLREPRMDHLLEAQTVFIADEGNDAPLFTFNKTVATAATTTSTLRWWRARCPRPCDASCPEYTDLCLTSYSTTKWCTAARLRRRLRRVTCRSALQTVRSGTGGSDWAAWRTPTAEVVMVVVVPTPAAMVE